MLRRHLWRWTSIAVILVATAIAIAAPSAAHATTCSPDGLRCGTFAPCSAGMYETGRAGNGAPICEYGTASLKHVGWTYLNLNYCAPGRMCAAVYRMSTPAWSWTGSAWRQASLSQGWVYVYPYTGEWRWAWTQQTGWVAISGGRFEVR